MTEVLGDMSRLSHARSEPSAGARRALRVILILRYSGTKVEVVLMEVFVFLRGRSARRASQPGR